MPQLIGHSLALTRIGGLADPSNTLHYNFLLNSGTAITGATKRGPNLTFTRASDAGSFTSAGVFALVGGNDLPRFAHDPADSNAKLGLLMEGAQTNKCLQSEALGTTWTLPGANTTLSAFATAAPDGNATAEDVLHGDSAETVQQTITVTDNTVVTISAFVHQGTTGAHDFVKMSWIDQSAGDNGFEAWFNISTGVVGTAQATGTGSYTAGSVFITDVGGGWFRIGATGQIVTGQTDGRFELINTTADAVDTAEATNSVAWWGLQVEEDSFPTSYIPTTTASVTRAKDVNTMTGFNGFSSSGGTLRIDANQLYRIGASMNYYDLVLDGDESNERNFIIEGSTNDLTLTVKDGGVGQVSASSSSNPITYGTLAKIIHAYALNDFIVYVDGSSVITDTSATVPQANELWIGSNFLTSAQFNGYFQIIKAWNVRKPNAFLVTETT